MITLESVTCDPSSVFIDSSAFLAFMEGTHPYHQKAVSFLYELDDLDRPLITLNLIVYQLHELIKEQSGFADAQFFLQAVRKAEQSELLTIISVDETIEKAALRLIDENPEHELTFPTACSLTVMSRLGIQRIFSFDQHVDEICNYFPRVRVVPSYI